MARYSATIEERGNGLADVGDYVSESGGVAVYRVISTGRIDVPPSGSGGGLKLDAVVEQVDWDDLSDEEADDITCSVTIGDELE